MKVFTNNEFIKKLNWLTNDVKNVYYSGSNWSKLNKNGYWQFDCVVSIKSILWGFSADKNKLRGGTIYKSNGVADFTCNGGLNYCTKVSKDFKNIIPGEYLCMKGTKYNHSGIYLGNGKVFEDTTGWNVNKCVISDISSDGTRSLNGKKLLKWTYHGLLNYIDYNDQQNDIANKSLDQLVKETMDGKYGNGEARKKALGSRYREVQDRINEILYGKKKYYIVKKGDTLIKIAKKLGIKNWKTLYNNNKKVIGNNPNLIYPGQKLQY